MIVFLLFRGEAAQVRGMRKDVQPVLQSDHSRQEARRLRPVSVLVRSLIPEEMRFEKAFSCASTYYCESMIFRRLVAVSVQ